ncbi:MAG TPA: hypothetical protein VHW70_02265 [Edaphobacter sp.]|nr:hypothetical protein [Edaphobacter sp.]
MRRVSIISAFLAVMIAISTFGCATGMTAASSSAKNSCSHPGARAACARKRSGASTAQDSACIHTLKSQQGQCSLRDLAQFQFAELRGFAIASPFSNPHGNASPSSDSTILVSSIGSPQTDRGPPVS